MRRRRRERVIPMPTEEDKKKAQLKAASADPLVWAMKSVDDKFPDEREKNEETIKAEAEIEETMGSTMDDDEMLDDDDLLDDIDEEPETHEVKEIKAEGKTAMPTDDGVMTVDVAPMRQNVDNVSRKQPAEVKKVEEDLKKSELKKLDVKRIEGKRSEIKKVKPASSMNYKMIFGFAMLIILALGGVAFGVVAMINQNKATLELANQIVASSDHENQVDDEYIYLKDWGMKIKIVSGLEHVSFDYDNDEYSSVLVWGARKNDAANYTPDFAKQSKNGNPMGIVNRVPRYERAAAGRLIWYDDFYNYYYQGPSSEPEANENEMGWWVESYLLIKEMLTNADNYIKFNDNTISQQ